MTDYHKIEQLEMLRDIINRLVDEQIRVERSPNCQSADGFAWDAVDEDFVPRVGSQTAIGRFYKPFRDLWVDNINGRPVSDYLMGGGGDGRNYQFEVDVEERLSRLEVALA